LEDSQSDRAAKTYSQKDHQTIATLKMLTEQGGIPGRGRGVMIPLRAASRNDACRIASCVLVVVLLCVPAFAGAPSRSS